MVGYVELSRHSLTFRDLRLFGQSQPFNLQCYG